MSIKVISDQIISINEFKIEELEERLELGSWMGAPGGSGGSGGGGGNGCCNNGSCDCGGGPNTGNGGNGGDGGSGTIGTTTTTTQPQQPTTQFN